MYIHTTNRQQNTQTQYPRHREKPGINMTQATTTTVLKYNCCMESYTTSKHSTKTTIACDTSSIQVDITDTMVYAITLCKLLDFTQSFG